MLNWFTEQSDLRPAVWLIYLIAAALLLIAVRDAIESFQVINEQGQRLEAKPTPATRLSDNQDYRLDDIISAHLFGRESTPQQREIVEAPETKLKMELKGAIASADPRYSRAIISVEKQPGKSYAVGALVEKTDAHLYKVDTDQILLERGGQLETLTLLRPMYGDGRESDYTEKQEPLDRGGNGR